MIDDTVHLAYKYKGKEYPIGNYHWMVIDTTIARFDVLSGGKDFEYISYPIIKGEIDYTKPVNL